MKKNNKAFTLIELLAIIVILAIIAVITIPIILNVIENSRKGAAIDSAYGYKDAISKYYLSEMIDNQNLKLDGAYSVDNGTLKKGSETPIQIPTSGTAPSIGWIKIKENEVVKGCLTIGDYKVEINDKTVTATKGICPNESPKKFQRVISSDSDLTIGDEVAIDTEHFYVTKIEGNSVWLIAKYNLNVGESIKSSEENQEGLQLTSEEDCQTYGNVEFSEVNYWMEEYKRKPKYETDYIYDVTFNGAPGSSNYSIAYYVESYVEMLINQIGAPKNIIGGLVGYTGYTSFITGPGFWTGMAASYEGYVTLTYIYIDSFNNKLSSGTATHDSKKGVRPVIEVSKDDIEL